jgi:hypothetical protein
LIKEDDPIPARHTFSVSAIYFILRLKNNSLPFRSASTAMKILKDDEVINKAPSHETCIQWNLKVGLYKLQKEKSRINEWCWIVDHVVGNGPLKCLAVLGVPLNVLQDRDDLTLSLCDLEPFGLIPMSHTSGDDVHNALLKISSCTGIVPRSIISDHGPDLWLGVKKYCKEHENKTVDHYDVCHKVASELKKLFLKDSRWTEFCEQATQTKRELFNTELVRYAPPNQRNKSRYLNTDILIGWAVRTLKCRDQIPVSAQKKMGWIFGFQNEIELWQEWNAIGQETRNEIRRRGFEERVEERLAKKLFSMQMTKSSEELACKLINYVGFESSKLKIGEKSLGSTEVIESLFGYYKNTKAGLWDSYGGIGRTILTMASKIGDLSRGCVKTALETIRVQDVSNWLEETLICC